MKSTQSNMYLPKSSLWLILVVGLLSLISFSGHAQVRLGLTASPSFTWLTPDNNNYDNDGVRLGIRYGLIADFPLFESENYFLNTGFTLNHVGGKLTAPAVGTINSINIGTKGSGTYKLRYIDIPLAIKLKTNEIGYLSYFGLFGSELGFNTFAKQDFDFDNALLADLEDEDIKDDINIFKASLLIGGGVEYNISGNTMIVAGFTYANGLTNILKGDALLADGNGNATVTNNEAIKDKELKTRSNYFMINVAVLF